MAGKWKRRAKERAERIANLESHLAEQGRYAATLQEHLAIAKREVAQAREWAEQAEKDNQAMRSQVYTLQQLLNDGCKGDAK